ncbi:MAG: RNA methyltransferase [Halobacteria archaeon]|nr:RNA methyltransferase [Halobacteria archaeon]
MELKILVPASLVAEKDDARIRTYKIGQVARAASVFRCDEIVVYDDEPKDETVPLILRYAVTPPYLRKEIFDRREELEYVGVVPPLRIPPHSVGSDGNTSESHDNDTEYRQGVVTKVGSDGRVRVNCGLQHPVALRDTNVEEGERVTLRIESREPVRAEITPENEVPLYWGYEVVETSLPEWLDAYDGTVIATSRRGKEVGGNTFDAETLALVFGSPERGVHEILRDYYGYEDASEEFDSVVNTIPNQGTETVRTEEAVFATLSLVNVQRM